MCFSLWNNVLNHKDILYISFLKYLKDTEVNINNILIMTEDFNIRDCLWDPSKNW